MNYGVHGVDSGRFAKYFYNDRRSRGAVCDVSHSTQVSHCFAMRNTCGIYDNCYLRVQNVI